MHAKDFFYGKIDIFMEDGYKQGVFTEEKGCLSFPGEWGITKRPEYVKVKALDRNGEEFTVEGRELLAKAFCHELDHLNGVVFKDVAERILTPEEIEEMESADSEEKPRPQKKKKKKR